MWIYSVRICCVDAILKTMPYFKNKLVTLYKGDSRAMEELRGSSVDFIVTSPPYWNLKNYKTSSQLGLGQTYEEYLVELKKVFDECKRVLKDGRFFALNIGTRVSDGELKHIPSDTIQMLGKMGFTLRKEIIWTKPKGTQGLWQRGVTQFLKSKPYPREANFNIQHEYILIFQKNTKSGEPVDIPDKYRKASVKLEESFIKEVAWSHWNIKVSKHKHPAPFPIELPHRLIKLYSFPNEIVLDPFMGSGSTAIAASQLKRRSIGYEISKEFCDMSRMYIQDSASLA